MDTLFPIGFTGFEETGYSVYKRAINKNIGLNILFLNN
jgi:hypothetical protein